jgi:hypothetical protein
MIKFICHKKINLKVIDKTGWGYFGTGWAKIKQVALFRAFFGPNLRI